jgi:hypothetical protein
MQNLYWHALPNGWNLKARNETLVDCRAPGGTFGFYNMCFIYLFCPQSHNVLIQALKPVVLRQDKFPAQWHPEWGTRINL